MESMKLLKTQVTIDAFIEFVNSQVLSLVADPDNEFSKEHMDALTVNLDSLLRICQISYLAQLAIEEITQALTPND